jgi:hypothetical protein
MSVSDPQQRIQEIPKFFISWELATRAIPQPRVFAPLFAAYGESGTTN